MMLMPVVAFGLVMCGRCTVISAFNCIGRPAAMPPIFHCDRPIRRPPVALAANVVEQAEPCPNEFRRDATTNSFVLGSLLAAAIIGVLHNDVEKLANLAPDVDHYKAAVAMLNDLPTEWLAWYDDEALEFPLMTKASTSGVCYFIGDLCAQGLAGKSFQAVSLDRATRSAAAGFIGHGPIAHYWLEFLDQNLSFDGAWWAVIPKIAVDQGPMSIVYNTIYSMLLGAFAFRDPRSVLRDVRSAFWPGFSASIRFWPLVHLVTFSVIPVELQLLWIDLAEIVWVCILSRVNNEGVSNNKAANRAAGSEEICE